MTLDRALLDDGVAYAGEWIDYRYRTLEVPGVCVAIRLRDELLLSRAYGMADLDRGEPLRTDHHFRIASHSKVFTATALLQLAEEDKVSLDDRLGRWLDWLDPGAPVARLRLRHLLAHVGGVLRDGADCDFWNATAPFPDRSTLHAIASGPPVLASNERFKYSNVGYSLLGEVVEAVSGMPYADVVAARILRPLGLGDTGVEPGPAVADAFATGHSSRRYGLPRRAISPLDTAAFAPATGFHSTAEDLSRFGAALALGSGELLTDDSKREMHHEQWKIEGPDALHYGLGVLVAEVGDRRVIAHGGAFPGFITDLYVDPTDGLVVCVLTNAIDGPSDELARGVLRILQRSQTASKPDDVASLDRFTGRFFDLWGALDVVRLGGDLLGIGLDAPDPMLQPAKLELRDESTLHIAEASGFGCYGEDVRYEFDEDGRPRQIRYAGLTASPLAAFLAEHPVMASAP